MNNSPLCDTLPAQNLDIPSFYAEPVEARHVGAGLADDRKLVRRATARKTLNLLHVANVARTLDCLPAAGESWHIINRGNWPAWALVPTFLRLIAPAKIASLSIATLGFSRANGDELLQLLDAGDIGQVGFVASCYFKSNDADLWSWFSHELAKRGHRAVAVRNHAKIIAIKTAAGDCFTVETSANLRSCRNIEQFCITNDRELFELHAEWMTEVAK